MKMLLLLSFVLVTGGELLSQAKPTPTAPPPQTQPAPAPPKTAPAAPRRAPASTRSGMAITVTDAQGGALQGVLVEVMGVTDRKGDTNASGQINFPGMPAGTYRLRFTDESVITFEREVALRAGQVADVDVTLNPAPARAPAPAPTPPPPTITAEKLGPIGAPQTLNAADLVEKEFIRREPRRESLISCSGNTRTTMLQLNEPMAERLYESAEVVYYVLGGEGTVRLNGQENKVTTNGVLSVPRGVSHSFARRGNRPLILLAILSGEPCDTAK